MKARILIVEDNVDLAENLAEIFEDEGATTTRAASAAEAARLAQEQEFDLIAVDIRLGSENGLDLVPMLKQHQPHGEVILMTGNATLDSAIEAIRRGVFAYVQKPFAPDQILTLASRALAQVALRQEKRALTERLESSEALYRGVVETVEACILGLDAAGTIRFANRYASLCAGLSMEQLVGSPLSSMWLRKDAPSDAAEHVRLAIAGAPVRDLERDLERGDKHGGDKERRVLRWTLTPLGAAAGHQAGGQGSDDAAVVLAVGLDITDRLALERRHAEGQALAAMGALTTGLAHEIRNPLNAAKLQLELLLRRAGKLVGVEDAPRITGPADIVRTEIERLAQLLNEFLLLARPRAVEAAHVSVRRLFDEVLDLQGPGIQAANLSSKLELESDDLAVAGDHDRLKQVIINLIGNAIEAMREQGHGTITLEATRHGKEICLRVIDDGPGVSPDIRETLFQAFVTNKEAGTGLGLSIVKSIIERHKGSVRMLAAEGGGTVIEIMLPSSER